MHAHAVGEPESVRQPGRLTVWAARALTAVPILMMLVSASMKLTRSPEALEQFVGTFGYAESALLWITALELACAAVYAIPRTAVLGAVLLTGYLGAAIATHVRVGDPGFVVPLLLGLSAWGGIFLREERLRALLPIREKRMS